MKFFDYSELREYKSKKLTDETSLTFNVDNDGCCIIVLYRKNKNIHGFLFDWLNRFQFNKNDRDVRHYVWKDELLR